MKVLKVLLFTLFLCTVVTGGFKALAGNNYQRDIYFSGYRWEVKSSIKSPGGRTAPNNNYFSSSYKNVWVDVRGRLHLKIAYRRGKWYCSEVITLKSFGYGRYLFYIDSDLAEIDDNVIVGLFTWDTSPEYSHREIDIEFSRWGGQLKRFNSQYVVQNALNTLTKESRDGIFRFNISHSSTPTVHIFEWMPDYINFESYYIDEKDGSRGNIIASWRYIGNNIPIPGNEKVRINVYLFNGLPPGNGKDFELIVRKFKFIKLKY